MPTFEDPKVDADELGQAARGLAYATRNIKTPSDTYDMLGSLHHALSGVEQSLRQLSSWHQRHGQFAATDKGERAAGQEHAVRASGWLAIAAASTEKVIQLVMKAQAENGSIAWQPDRHIAAASNQLTALAKTLTAREAPLTSEVGSPSGVTGNERGLSR